MFDFLKKIFGWNSECSDCEGLDETETNESDTPTFPEEVKAPVDNTPVPVEQAQPSLKMSMPTTADIAPIEEVVESTPELQSSEEVPTLDETVPTV